MRKFSKLTRSVRSHIHKFLSMLVFCQYTIVYSAITISNKRGLDWLYTLCMQMYFEIWKYICFWGARSRNYKLHVHDFFFPVHLGVLPPPNTKKLATLLPGSTVKKNIYKKTLPFPEKMGTWMGPVAFFYYYYFFFFLLAAQRSVMIKKKNVSDSHPPLRDFFQGWRKNVGLTQQ